MSMPNEGIKRAMFLDRTAVLCRAVRISHRRQRAVTASDKHVAYRDSLEAFRTDHNAELGEIPLLRSSDE
ncbi:hypothetical protein SNOG_06358 [Parastagonospora nodorum SN15]|uniref:Uncharacterized protein n=1 Tax=Phaeosphaeria nodorum (strain SN15 / ATCC MYA-4574 / FGSC 10173) TaxID=321614 RepID=Q0UPF6_PHANO|nr:hypothetical protein SNOG_06358 [Parastagonospora nodorum SN15]EAT86189.1 hypothetical protein SNOG_06358 [Parastagonospora nodorum SN15]